VTYRAELSGRALKQMHGLPGPAFDSLIEAMAEVVDYPDGFEAGILAAGYLATDSEGQTFVVVAMLSNPAEALPFPSAVTGLQAIIRAAFELVR